MDNLLISFWYTDIPKCKMQYVFVYGNKYKLIDIINILELIFIINTLINIYYSNTTRTQLITTNTTQCAVYII